MNQDLNIARLAQCKSSFDYGCALCDVRHAGLAKTPLDALSLNGLEDLFRSATAAVTGEVDDYIGTSLGQLNGDSSTNASKRMKMVLR